MLCFVLFFSAFPLSVTLPQH